MTSQRAISPDQLPRRVAEKIEVVESGCWQWTASLNGGGYGQISFLHNGKRHWIAHRLVYCLMVGEPAEHMHHQCHVRTCVNPLHLEAMDPSAHSILHNAGRPTCSAGHALTTENTYFRKDGKGRQCRICKARRQRTVYARKLPAERVILNAEGSARRRRRRAVAAEQREARR